MCYKMYVLSNKEIEQPTAYNNKPAAYNDKPTAYNDRTTEYNNKPTAYNDKPTPHNKYYHIRQLWRSIFQNTLAKKYTTRSCKDRDGGK